MDTIINLMAVKANELGLPSYIGDLIHDGAWIASKSHEIKTFIWIFKGNNCGTWLSGDRNFAKTLLTGEPPRAMFEIQILQHGNYGPEGTLMPITESDLA